MAISILKVLTEELKKNCRIKSFPSSEFAVLFFRGIESISTLFLKYKMCVRELLASAATDF